jgi:predicted GIY-YIG superfamily endonuclease
LREILESLNLPTGWCTYLLICENASYYVGSTQDLFQRILDHASGKGATHTRNSKPQFFAWYEPNTSQIAALVREKQLKGWSRSKKSQLSRGESPFQFGFCVWINLD